MLFINVLNACTVFPPRISVSAGKVDGSGVVDVVIVVVGAGVVVVEEVVAMVAGAGVVVVEVVVVEVLDVVAAVVLVVVEVVELIVEVIFTIVAAVLTGGGTVLWPTLA